MLSSLNDRLWLQARFWVITYLASKPKSSSFAKHDKHDSSVSVGGDFFFRFSILYGHKYLDSENYLFSVCSKLNINKIKLFNF